VEIAALIMVGYEKQKDMYLSEKCDDDYRQHRTRQRSLDICRYFSKKPRQFVTVKEFDKYTGIPEQQIDQLWY
jgi:hypothetical protein